MMGGIMQLVAFGCQDVFIGGVHTHNGSPHRCRGGRIYARNLKKSKHKKIRNENILKDKKFKNYKNKYQQTECVICLERFKPDDFVAVRKCKHIYHSECDNKAIVNCPICRQ